MFLVAGGKLDPSCTHFLRMEMNVLSFDPSFWCSSAGALSGGCAAEADEELPVNAHMMQAPRALLATVSADTDGSER
jgi:hypothetical protein